jgi:hypothetical protein
MRGSSGKLTDTIRHEFGHLVVPKLLGFSTGSVELELAEARAQIELRPTFKCLRDVADYGRRRVQVLYAGAGAEALGDDGIIDPDGVERLLKTTSSNDHAKIRELLRITSAIEHPEAVDDDERRKVTTAIDTELRLKTGELVENHSALIVDLTNFFIKQMGARRTAYSLLAKDIDEFPGVDKL